VQHDDRNALRVAALLDIDMVPVAHVQHPLIERVDRRIEVRGCALLACELSMGFALYSRIRRPRNGTRRKPGEATCRRYANRRCIRDRQVRGDGRRMVGSRGKFKPLHMLNPCRLDYITAQIAAEFDRDLKTDAPFAGLRILDIGCGGGLLSEPMARLGADVVGADPAARNIPVARSMPNSGV
jgi:hypothetical protein